MRHLPAACAALFLASSASAHRLDEYLQATLISIGKDRVQALMRLTPGVAVSSFVLAGIDTNADGVISRTEQRVYAERVLRDVSLTIYGQVLRPRLISVEFPEVEAMKEGTGEIQIEFDADLPRGARDRKLVFEDHHQNGISAYLVNCLAPPDRDLRVVAQNRNERQSFYELTYVQAGASLGTLPVKSSESLPPWPFAAALVLLARLAFLWRERVRNRRGGKNGLYPVKG
jgi:hypothetical protein